MGRPWVITIGAMLTLIFISLQQIGRDTSMTSRTRQAYRKILSCHALNKHTWTHLISVTFNSTGEVLIFPEQRRNTFLSTMNSRFFLYVFLYSLHTWMPHTHTFIYGKITYRTMHLWVCAQGNQFLLNKTLHQQFERPPS